MQAVRYSELRVVPSSITSKVTWFLRGPTIRQRTEDRASTFPPHLPDDRSRRRDDEELPMRITRRGFMAGAASALASARVGRAEGHRPRIAALTTVFHKYS